MSKAKSADLLREHDPLMYGKWFGAGLLLISLLVTGIAGANVKALYKKQGWAKTEKDGTFVDVKGQTVLVPPWNSSTGWVGFDIALPNEGKTGYSAHGTIAPADQDPNPNMVMRAVNESGLDYLTFDLFSEAAWNVTQAYADALLDSTSTYRSFEFYGLDNCSKYIIVFRSLKEEAQDRPILVSIEETWFEPGNLLELTPWNASIIAVVALTGLGLIIYDLNSGRKKRKLKHRQPIRNCGEDKRDLKAKKKE